MSENLEVLVKEFVTSVQFDKYMDEVWALASPAAKQAFADRVVAIMANRMSQLTVQREIVARVAELVAPEIQPIADRLKPSLLDQIEGEIRRYLTLQVTRMCEALVFEVKRSGLERVLRDMIRELLDDRQVRP